MGSRQNPSNPRNGGHDPASVYTSSPLAGRRRTHSQARAVMLSRLPYASASARNQPLSAVQIAQLQPLHRATQEARPSTSALPPPPATPNHTVHTTPQGIYNPNPPPANTIHPPATPTFSTAPSQFNPEQKLVNLVAIAIPELFSKLESTLLDRLGTLQTELNSIKPTLNQVKDDVQQISQAQTSIQKAHSDAFKEIESKAAALQLAIGESKLGYGTDKSRTILGRLDDIYLAFGDVLEKMIDKEADACEMEHSASSSSSPVELRSVGTSPIRSVLRSRSVEARTPTPPRVLVTAQVGTTPCTASPQRPTSSSPTHVPSHSEPYFEASSQDVDMADPQSNESAHQIDIGPSQPSFITSSPKVSGANNVLLQCNVSPIQGRDSQISAGFSSVDWSIAIAKPQASPQVPRTSPTCQLSSSFLGPLKTAETAITIQQPDFRARRTIVPAHESDQVETDQEHLLEAGTNAIPSPAITERSTVPDLQYPTRESTVGLEHLSQVPMDESGVNIDHGDKDRPVDEDVYEDMTILKKDAPLREEGSPMTPKSLTTVPQPDPPSVPPATDQRKRSRGLDSMFGSELSPCPSSHSNHGSSIPHSNLPSPSQANGVDASKPNTLSRAPPKSDALDIPATSPKSRTVDGPMKSGRAQDSIGSNGDDALASPEPKSSTMGANPTPISIEQDISSEDVISSLMPNQTREAEETHEAEMEASIDIQMKTPTPSPADLPSSVEIAHIDAELTAPSDTSDIDNEMDEELDQLLPSSQVSEVDGPSSFTSQQHPSSIKTVLYTSSLTDAIQSMSSIDQLSSIQQSPSDSSLQASTGNAGLVPPSVSEHVTSSVRENSPSPPKPSTPKALNGLTTSPLSSVPPSSPPPLKAINPTPSTPVALPSYISPVNSPVASPRPSATKKSYKRKFDEMRTSTQAVFQSQLQSAQKESLKKKRPSVISPTPYRVAPRPFKRTVRVEDALRKEPLRLPAEAGTSKSVGQKQEGNQTSPIVISSAATTPTSEKPQIIDLTDSPSIIQPSSKMGSKSDDTSVRLRGKAKAEKERLENERREKQEKEKREKEEQERRERAKKREKEKKLLPIGADDSDDAEIIPAKSFKAPRLVQTSSEDHDASEDEATSSAPRKLRNLKSIQVAPKEQAKVDFRKLVAKQNKKESKAVTKVKRKGRASTSKDNEVSEEPPIKRARTRLNSVESDSASPASGLREIRSSSRKSITARIEKDEPLNASIASINGKTKQQAEPSPNQKLRNRTGTSNKLVKWPTLRNGEIAFQRRFILCDLCNLWYHYGCVAIRPGDIRLKDTEIFTCPPCETIGLPANPNLPKDRAKSPGDSCNRPDCAFKKAETPANEYFVKRIIGRRSRMIGGRGRVDEWLVEWDGYPISEATWETPDSMNDPDQLTEEFVIAAKKEGLDLDGDPYATVLLKVARKSK